MGKKVKKKQQKKKNVKQIKNVNEPWYNNTIFVLLMLITVFPLGLFLILRNERLKRDLWPIAKVVIIAALIIITYTLIAGDWQKPELEVKDEMTYSTDQNFGTDQLITDYVISVSDNETDLSIEDVSIVKYEDLDLTTKGTKTIKFLVKDDAMNVTTKEAKLIIE